MSSLNISFFGATDIGRVRTNNEDTFIARHIWDDRHILLAAIDGMGGEEGGEVAAEIARESIIKYLTDFQNDTVLNLIKRAVAEANNEIIRHKEVQPQFMRMGCVATAGIIDLDEGTLSIAHVGDSRLYRLSNGELSKLTHDHSLVGYQEEQGILTEEQAMRHPRRSIIERCLGGESHTAEDKSFIEAGVFPLIEGETFLFCSDGVCDVLTSAQITECLKSKETPEEECQELIARANEAGGKDNITAVIARVIKAESTEDSPKADDVEDEKDVKDEGKESNVDSKSRPQCSKKCGTKTKWMLIFVGVLAVCSAAAFFIGMNYSQQKSEPETTADSSTVAKPKQSVVAKNDTTQPKGTEKDTINTTSNTPTEEKTEPNKR